MKADRLKRRPTSIDLLFGSLLVAVLCNVILNIPVGIGTVSTGMLWMLGAIDFRGIIFLWLLLMLFRLATSLHVASRMLFISLSMLISATNYIKISYLQIPLLPSDIEFLGEMDLFVQLVNPWLLVFAVAALVSAVSAGFLADLRLFKTAKPDGREVKKTTAIRILATICLVSIGLASLKFHSVNNPLRYAVESTGKGWAAWSQIDNAGINGFIAATLYNMPTTGMRIPEGYSEKRMRELVDEYGKDAMLSAADKSNEEWNIVLILSESVGEIRHVPNISLSSNPFPNLDQLTEENWGGTLLADQYGSGTSNMEFQVLTGGSTGFFAPGVSSAYQSYLADLTEAPSLSGWLKTIDYRVIGMLPDERGRYKRPMVYEAMGFDEFESLDRFRYDKKIERNTFVADSEVFAGVLESIESTSGPLLANVLTMQNHVPINDWYQEPIKVSGEVDELTGKRIGMWSRGLEYSDQALKEFLDELETLNEPTAVIYYGDHFPGIMSKEFLNKHDPLTFRTTPVLLWSNRENDSEPQVFSRISASTLVPHLYQMLGLELPPYYEFLLRIEREVGTVLREGVYTNRGELLRFEDLNSAQQKLLNDYQLIQYDFSLGQRFALDELWYKWQPMAPAS